MGCGASHPRPPAADFSPAAPSPAPPAPPLHARHESPTPPLPEDPVTTQPAYDPALLPPKREMCSGAPSIEMAQAGFNAGIDCNGERICIHTASHACQSADQAGVSQFVYTGDHVPPSDPLKPGMLHLGNVRHGYGTIRYMSGARYAGQWEDDKRSGTGVFLFACGDVYEGGWFEGRYEGHGTYTKLRPAGTSFVLYDGEWKADQQHGHGCYVDPETGDAYEGQFVHGLREGFGTYTSEATGKTEEGEYRGGEPINHG
jgi:hypothetical protein